MSDENDGGRAARLAVAETLAQELNLDLSPEVLAAVDRFLMMLWMRGYQVVPHD